MTLAKGQDTKSVNNLLHVINMFSSYPGLKSNLSKCKLVGKGSPNEVKKVICKIKCIDLTKEVLRISLLLSLGTFSPYDKKTELEEKSKKCYLGLKKSLEHDG